jgi:hypothetical protein
MKIIKTYEGFFKKSKSDTAWNEIEMDKLETLGFQLQRGDESLFFYIPKSGEIRKIEIDKVGNESYDVYLKMESSDDDVKDEVESLSNLIEYVTDKIPSAEAIERKSSL